MKTVTDDGLCEETKKPLPQGNGLKRAEGNPSMPGSQRGVTIWRNAYFWLSPHPPFRHQISWFIGETFKQISDNQKYTSIFLVFLCREPAHWQVRNFIAIHDR